MNSKNELILIWLFAALGTAPILIVDYMPSHDGPAHVYLGQVLRLYDESPLFGAYFSENWNFQPNLFVYALLQPLLSVFTPAAAEKSIAVLYVLLIPCATIALANALRQSRLVLYLLLWPMLYGFMFFFGFYNFCFSLLFTLAGLALWLRLRRTNAIRDAIWLLLVSLAAYFTHLFPVANLLLIVGVGSVANTLQTTSGQATAGTRFGAQLAHLLAHLFKASWRPALALLPVFVLIVVFIVQNAGSGPSQGVDYGFVIRLTHLSLMSFNLAYAPMDALFSILLLIIFSSVFLSRDRVPGTGWKSSGHFFVFSVLTIVYGVLFFIIPATLAGSTFVFDRLAPFLYLALALTIVCARLNDRQRKILVCGLIAVGAALPLYRTYQFHQLDRFLAPFHRIAAHIQPNHTILSVRGAPFPNQSILWAPYFRVNTPLNASTMTAAENNLVDLKVVQANTHKTPLRYRDDRNPYWFLPANQAAYPARTGFRTFENLRLEASTPDLDFDGYGVRSGGRVDYLLVWGPVAAYENTVAGKEFLANVARSFKPVDIDAGADFLRLYESRQKK